MRAVQALENYAEHSTKSITGIVHYTAGMVCGCAVYMCVACGDWGVAKSSHSRSETCRNYLINVKNRSEYLSEPKPSFFQRNSRTPHDDSMYPL